MRKKLSPLVQAMNLFEQMDERDKQTLADWIRSQTATPRKKSTKKKAETVSDVSTASIAALHKSPESNVA